MSQIKFKHSFNERQVEVMAGWDVPLQEYFMSIMIDDPDLDEEEIIWSSIFNSSREDKDSTSRFKDILETFNIATPDNFWQTVERKEGNVTYIL